MDHCYQKAVSSFVFVALEAIFVNVDNRPRHVQSAEIMDRKVDFHMSMLLNDWRRRKYCIKTPG